MRIIDMVVSRTPAFVTPNRLSWFRIWVIPILWITYILNPLLAFFLYVVACITDWLDGHLARRRNLFTTYGKRLDEVSDKVLALGTLGLLFADGIIHLDLASPLFWCVVIIVVRECLVTTLREIWPKRAERIPTIDTAKTKTVLMMMGFGLLMLGGLRHPFWQQAAEWGALLVFVSMLFALWSGAAYVWHFLKRY